MNREGQSEWRMDVPDSRAGLAPLGCRDCESGGLWWLDPGHDPMVTMTRRPDFAFIYTTRRYAVHAAAGVTLNAGHVSDLGRGGACIQPTTPFFTGAGPLPRVIPLVYDSWLAPLLRCPACAPALRARHNREFVLNAFIHNR